MDVGFDAWCELAMRIGIEIVAFASDLASEPCGSWSGMIAIEVRRLRLAQCRHDGLAPQSSPSKLRPSPVIVQIFIRMS